MRIEKSILTLNCFPSIAWFVVFLNSDEVQIEKQETFQKQTFRNRYQILTSQGVKDLTVPIKKPNPKPLTREILIDDSQNWQVQHWRTIQSAYGNSPYFEFLKDDLKEIYDTKWHRLFELNLGILTICLRILRVKKELFFTETYQKQTDQRLKDFRISLSAPNKNIDTKILDCKSYTQVFGNEFVNNLSILDLLLNQGVEAKYYLADANLKL